MNGFSLLMLVLVVIGVTVYAIKNSPEGTGK